MTVARMELASELLPRPDKYDITRAAGAVVRIPGKITLTWDTMDKTTPFTSGLATVDSLRTAYTDHAPSVTFKDEAGSNISVLWLTPPQVSHVKGSQFNLYQVTIELIEP